MTAPNPSMPGEFLISSPHHGYCDVLFVGKLFESFRFWAIVCALRNLDDYALRGEREHGLPVISIA